jgi:hypothetical protein
VLKTLFHFQEIDAQFQLMDGIARIAASSKRVFSVTRGDNQLTMPQLAFEARRSQLSSRTDKL